MRRLALGLRKGKRRLRPPVRLRVGEQRPLFRSTLEEKGGVIRLRAYSQASPPYRSTPEENRGRNTMAGVREGFAPPGHSQVSSENLLS